MYYIKLILNFIVFKLNFFFFFAPRRGRELNLGPQGAERSEASQEKVSPRPPAPARSTHRCHPPRKFSLSDFYFFYFRKNHQLIIFHIFFYNKLANQISAFWDPKPLYIFIIVMYQIFIIKFFKNVPNFS